MTNQESFQYQKRQENHLIKDYISKNLNKFSSLDYYIEEVFDPEDLIDILKEDLPEDPSLNCKLEFINDIAKVSQSFFENTKSKNIRVQIKIVETDMCRLFHVDNIKQRLLCSYHGDGTQWLEESNINRDGLGKGDNQNIVKDFDKIRNASEFDLLILRGCLYNNQTQGAVHRSPSISSKGNKRVLLKIDEC